MPVRMNRKFQAVHKPKRKQSRPRKLIKRYRGIVPALMRLTDKGKFLKEQPDVLLLEMAKLMTNAEAWKELTKAQKSKFRAYLKRHNIENIMEE